MKKFLIILFTLTVLLPRLSFSEEKSLSIMNNGFEIAEQNKLKYWSFSGPDGALIVDSKIYFEGKQSAQINLQNHSTGVQLLQSVDVEAFKRYDFGGSIKTENLEGGFAEVKLIFLDKNGKEIKGVILNTAKVSGSQDWSVNHSWIESPAGADTVYIICFVSGKGKAWFDDIQFSSKIKGGY
jgi:hypothetical protein